LYCIYIYPHNYSPKKEREKKKKKKKKAELQGGFERAVKVFWQNTTCNEMKGGDFGKNPKGFDLY